MMPTIDASEIWLVGDPLDFAIITALVLAATQALGPDLHAMLARHAIRARSFGGGVGLAYVFLSLFPELDDAHPWLGRHIHLVAMSSFLLFFTLEAWLAARARRRRQVADTDDHGTEPEVFWLHIIVMFLYVAIVMFALPEVISSDLLFAVATGCLIGLHLVYKDYLLRAEAPAELQAAGRALLAAAPLLGWVAHRALEPSEAVLDIFVAILSGVLLQGVFRDELPRAERASLPWVLAGVGTFALLSVLT